MDDIETKPEPVESPLVAWERNVRLSSMNRCANCGSGEKLRAHMIVPREAGGLYVPSNGVMLCRVCDMARDSSYRMGSAQNRWLVNFWLSRQLHERLLRSLRTKNSNGHGFRSMSSLVRFLIDTYVANETMFEDLEQYQENNREIKVNCWVDRQQYENFQAMMKRRNLTVTDGLKALILMFDLEAMSVLRKG